jgi:hypothetical protein
VSETVARCCRHGRLAKNGRGERISDQNSTHPNPRISAVFCSIARRLWYGCVCLSSGTLNRSCRADTGRDPKGVRLKIFDPLIQRRYAPVMAVLEVGNFGIALSCRSRSAGFSVDAMSRGLRSARGRLARILP